MAKLKKSIKAIIISICAVVVLAGSIVGAVFANKNNHDNGYKRKDNNNHAHTQIDGKIKV